MKITIQALGRGTDVRTSDRVRITLESIGPVDAARIRALERTLIQGWTPEDAASLHEWLTPAEVAGMEGRE